MATDEVLNVIRGEFSKLRVPSSHDKVYKDECCLSFDSPYSPGGLYVNLVSLRGYGASYWRQDATKSGAKLYLHEEWVQNLKPENKHEEQKDSAPTKLAIGTKDGFNAFDSPYETTKVHRLCVLMPTGSVTFLELPCLDIPEFVNNILNAIIAHDGMKNKMQVDTWSADSEIKESQFAADLVQLDNGKKISSDPSTWKCEMSGDTENLWLNLSTGYIGGGRKNWDGTGGSGAALAHYEETGKKYPLCVKLGTITAHSADVMSYAEDTMVTDSKLAEHLSHWGIDIQKLEKTDSTMAELEVKLNMKYDWAKIMESGSDLVPLSGPGLVGLRNIGSSCYMNSVLQCIAGLPEVQERYLHNRAAIIDSVPSDTAPDDFATQMSKLVHACSTDTYCAPPPEGKVRMQEGEGDADKSTLEKYVVAPRMLKHVVGKNHPEFSGGKQQDAAEYFQYFLEQMSRAERTALTRFMPTGTAPTSSLFEFHLQSKMKCTVTNEVRLPACGTNTTLDLRVPTDRAINKEEIERYEQEAKKAKLDDGSSSSTTDIPKLDIPFQVCLDCTFEDETIELSNPSLGGQSTPCISNTRFRSFPPYLAIKLNRYVIGANWVQVKVDARIAAPQTLDLSSYTRDGLGPGEVAMPESSTAGVDGGASSADADSVEADAGIVMQLVSMGFSENGSKRAAIATNNADAETAMNWVFAHMEDPDFNDPPAPAASTPQASGVASTSAVSQESIEMLQNYGFNAIQCEAALRSTDGNLERAADWLFSHDNAAGITAETLAAMVAGESESGASASASSAAIPEYGEAGSGKYELIGMISHLGSNVTHGHYVCHRKLPDGKWALYNDEKVALSTNPPFEHAYMYFYKRI